MQRLYNLFPRRLTIPPPPKNPCSTEGGAYIFGDPMIISSAWGCLILGEDALMGRFDHGSDTRDHAVPVLAGQPLALVDRRHRSASPHISSNYLESQWPTIMVYVQ